MGGCDLRDPQGPAGRSPGQTTDEGEHGPLHGQPLLYSCQYGLYAPSDSSARK